MIRTVLELDLAGYTDIALALEESLDIDAVRSFEDQIQTFVDEGLAAVKLQRDRVVLGTAGDNAIAIFESAEQMHEFAATVQHACQRYNADKTTPLARRWFRMGAATGPVEVDSEKRRIIGTTIARAVRLEAASDKGSMLIDRATFEALPEAIRAAYGPPRTIKGKRDERFVAYRARFVPNDLIGEEFPRRSWRRRAVLLAALAAFAAVTAAVGFLMNGATTTPTSSAPIRGTADIHVFNSEAPDRDDRPISYKGLLPLLASDRLHLEVQLDQPAFLYLIWIVPSGEVIPVYPWRSGDWTAIEGKEPLAKLIYPSEDSEGIRMKENIEGREVFLALARATPLPADYDLKGAISRCIAKLPIGNAHALVRFRNHEVEATSGHDRGEDPFRHVAETLKQELGSTFDFIEGMAFASGSAPK
jgi:class 3 adenylate cyclase